MRLLFLNHNVAWSRGTFFRAFHLGRMLVRRGHEVTLMSISRRRRFTFETEEHQGVSIVESPDLLSGAARSGWDPWDALRRWQFARRQTWDLVHAFDSRPAVVLPALALARRGVPLVMDWADWWGRGGTIDERLEGRCLRGVIRPVETFFEEHFRTRADGTTVISAALGGRAAVLGVPPETILTLPGGSDIEAIQPRPRHEGRATTGVDSSIRLVGYLGTLLRGDADLMFETFTRIHAARPAARLVLIGAHKATVPPHPAIIETGFVRFERMLDWLASCDLLLLPLRDTIANRGRWPSKVNDYLAAGRPIVTTAVGDVARLFADWQIGEAVHDDAGALAEAAIRLLDDEGRREEHGRNARAVAQGDLAWSALAARVDDFYARVLSGRTNGMRRPPPPTERSTMPTYENHFRPMLTSSSRNLAFRSGRSPRISGSPSA